MTYYSFSERELSQLGLQENELAIYTGTTNPQSSGTLSPGINSTSCYVYAWQDGQPRELDACFRRDRAGLDVLEVRAGEEEYAFLRDKPSGYIQQVSGPARPITIANLGAIPLRVDTLLGKFVVHTGSALRLDENAPRREKKKVMLTVSSGFDQPLKFAGVWDSISWRRLNIREEPFAANEGHCFAVLDGSAIVQSMEVNGKREIFMMDSPEPNPDYEIYIFAEAGDWVTLRFSRTDYRDGRAVQRSRTIPHDRWSKDVIYDLQKLRESPAQSSVGQCTADLLEVLELQGLTAETLLPDDQIREFARQRMRPLISDKLREFLENENKSGEQQRKDYGCSDADSFLSELPPAHQDGQKMPIPEPPENFPE